MLVPQEAFISPGSRIRDTYTVDSHIASGAFSDVYKVRHRYMGMQAMKVLRDARSESDRAQGLYEAFQLARISHPAIVRVFDGNRLEKKWGGYAYVTMELLEGGTLRDLAAFDSQQLQASLLDAAEQLASALAHAHGMTPAIVHRDIKPTNVLIERRSAGRVEVRLADFGLAVPIDPELGLATAAGTIIYRAPESFDGFETQASDVYSFGLTMYEAATAVFPFKPALRDLPTKTMGELIRAIQSAHRQLPVAPSYFRHVVHPAFDAVIMRCIASDSSMRIPDGCALLPAVRAMRYAAESDPAPTEPIRAALQLAGDPEQTSAALASLGAALRADAARGPSYVQFLSFLRAEVQRLGQRST